MYFNHIYPSDAPHMHPIPSNLLALCPLLFFKNSLLSPIYTAQTFMD